jgi:hypothetical protein
LTLPGVPGRRVSVSDPQTGCSLGFCPPRVCRPKPGPGFRPSSSHALSGRLPCGRRPAAPRSVDRSRLGRIRPTGKPAEGTQQPLQGSCTGTVLSVRVSARPGYWIHLGPRRALLPTGRPSLGELLSLPQSFRHRPWCRAQFEVRSRTHQDWFPRMNSSFRPFSSLAGLSLPPLKQGGKKKSPRKERTKSSIA